MTVAEFIEYLKGQPQDLPVAYACCSEYCMLDTGDINIEEHHAARPDGWIHSYYIPGSILKKYLVLPGN